ncbi:MAG: tryptophan--tRNA ligase, partial [Planctomycetaceae bacterium]
MESPKNADTCTVFELYRLFADEQRQGALRERYEAGGMGYGDAKEQLYQAAMEMFGPAFERRAALEANPDQLEDILRQGAAKARARAQDVLARVRAASGLLARPV